MTTRLFVYVSVTHVRVALMNTCALGVYMVGASV